MMSYSWMEKVSFWWYFFQEGYSTPLKTMTYIYIYPLKNDGWKMKCFFEMVPFQGKHVNFSGGGNQF